MNMILTVKWWERSLTVIVVPGLVQPLIDRLGFAAALTSIVSLLRTYLFVRWLRARTRQPPIVVIDQKFASGTLEGGDTFNALTPGYVLGTINPH